MLQVREHTPTPSPFIVFTFRFVVEYVKEFEGASNVVLDALNRKEEFQVEKPISKIQTLRAIFQGENNLEKKIKEAYMQAPLIQHHFKKLHEQRKVKGITLKERLFKQKKSRIYVPTRKLRMKNHAKRA
jgi:hypothetical protein